jgi:hypothetical protein
VKRHTSWRHAAASWGYLEYQGKVEQIRIASVEEGRGDPAKIIKAIRRILEKLGADMEAQKDGSKL